MDGSKYRVLRTASPLTAGPGGTPSLYSIRHADFFWYSNRLTIFGTMANGNDAFIHPTAVVDEGAQIGAGTHIWHFCHILPDSEIGENCNLGQNVVVMPHVKLGNRVKVQNNVSLYAGVQCEDDVFIGPSAVFTNVFNPRSEISRKSEFRPTHVKKGATIGANATLVCGITIGSYAFIGAGSVVTKDVRDFELVYGNPARFGGWMSAAGHKLHFGDDNEAVCSGDGSRYRLTEGRVEKI